MRISTVFVRNGWALRRVVSIVLVIVAVAAAELSAQARLEISRATLNWPTIELYYKVSCDGVVQPGPDRSQLRVVEDGVEVTNFTHLCPDLTSKCAMSVSLVFDASGSMNGTNNTWAKLAGRAFIDSMDGSIDEATILFFDQMVTIQQQMTTNRPMLHTAMDALPTGGATALWDATYAGIIEMLNNGVNDCRAVIVLTDGADAASTRTPQEIISLANRYRVRVLMVGLGGAINAKPMSDIASATGGRYFEVRTLEALLAAYAECYRLITTSFEECVLTYDRGCADGQKHTVVLSAFDVCGQAVHDTVTYTAPLDSSTFHNAWFRVDTATARPGDNVLVPLRVDPSLPFLDAGSYVLRYDTTLLRYNGFEATPTLLGTVPYTMRDSSGTLLLEVLSGMTVRPPQVLGQLSFHVEASAPESITAVELADIRLVAGCTKALRYPGAVRISSVDIPTIIPSGPLFFCDGGNVTLTAPDGMRSYAWSNGATSRSITVNFSGVFSVTTEDQQGVRATSNNIVVVKLLRPAPEIRPAGPIRVCVGGSATLDAGAGYASYRWSDGSTDRFLTVSGSGNFFVTVTDTYGCEGSSAFVNISIGDSIKPVITPSGSTTICEGKEVTLDAGVGYRTYSWSTGERTRSIKVGAAGSYQVHVIDPYGCGGTSDPVTVQVLPTPAATITRVGPPVPCEGDTLWLTANPEGVRYEWSDGRTERTRPVTVADNYHVTVWNAEGCAGRSMTLDAVFLPLPDKPVVTRVGEVLESTVALRWQWYHNGVPISGATERQYTPTESGSYQVRVWGLNNCSSLSDPLTVTSLDEVLPDASALTLYPDPTDGMVTMRLLTQTGGDVTILVTDVLGREVRHVHPGDGLRGVAYELDLRQLPGGLYLLRVHSGNKVWMRHIRKN